MDSSGNILVCGWGSVTGELNNWDTRKYSPDGTLLWSRTFSGPGGLFSDDRAFGIAVDGDDSVVVIGYTPEKWHTEKYDSDGNYLWQRDIVTDGIHEASAVAVDSENSVIIIGKAETFGDWRMVKYDVDGNLQWSKTYSGTYWSPYMMSVDCDSGGSIYVAGYVYAGTEGNNWLVGKLSPSGDLIWMNTYNGDMNEDDNAYAVTVDSAGNVIAGGAARIGSSSSSWLIRKYSPNGDFIWEDTYAFPGVWDIAVGPNDELIAAGRISRLIRWYDSGGNLLWQGEGSGPGSFADLDIGPKGTVAFAGAISSTVSSSDCLVSKYAMTNACFDAGTQAAPSPVYVGQWLTVTHTVTNTGTASATGLTDSLQVNSGQAFLEYMSGPVPATIDSLLPGQSGQFAWTFSIAGVGAVAMTLTVTGIDGGLGGIARAADTALIDTNAIGELETSLSVPASPIVMGEIYPISLTVTNTGPITVNSITAAIQANPGIILASGPVPSGPIDLGSSSATTFAWTFSVAGTGLTAITATATGADAGSALPRLSSSSGSVYSVAPPSLRAQLAVYVATASEGQSFPVTLTVTNVGGIAAGNVKAGLWKSMGDGDLTMEGPEPSAVAALAVDETAVFTWTATAIKDGLVELSGTAYTVLGGPSNVATEHLTVQNPASLEASSEYLPASICPGKEALFVVTVTNTGQSAAVGVNLIPPLQSGTSGPALIDGPDPSGPFPLLPAGTEVVFTYTVTAGTPGSLFLTTTPTATDFNSGQAVNSVAATAGASIAAPGSLDVAFRPPSATLMSVGHVTTISLSITNSGEIEISDVTAGISVGPGAGYFSGPFPATQAISAGFVAGISWTYTPTTSGAHVFSFTVTGLTCSGADPVSATTMGNISAENPALLAGEMALSTTDIIVGNEIWLSLTVTNTGDASALGVYPSMDIAGSGELQLLSGPVPISADIPGDGGSQTFSWTYSATSAGSISSEAIAVGTDSTIDEAVSTGSVPAPSPIYVRTPALLIIGQFDLLPQPTAIKGEVITANLTISNTGGVPATVDDLSIFETAPSILSERSSITPPLPVEIQPMSSQTLVWTYSAAGCGYGNLSVTITGVEIGTGRPLGPIPGASTMASVVGESVTILAEANPANTCAGVTSELSWAVLDTCGQAVEGAGVSFTLVSPLDGDAALYPVSGETNEDGIIVCRLKTDSAPGSNIVRADVLEGLKPSSTLQVDTVIAPSRIAVRANPKVVTAGDRSLITFTLFDICGQTLSGMDVTLEIVQPAMGTARLSSTVGVTGSDGTYSSELTTDVNPGTNTVRAKVSGGLNPTTQVDVAGIVPFEKEIIAYPNPISGDVLRIAIKLAKDTRSIEVEIYNAAFHRVYSGSIDGSSAGIEDLEIHGIGSWAPGPYLLKVRVTYDDGSDIVLPVVKLVVQR